MKKIISTCIALMVSAACSISAFAMEVPTNTTIQDLNGVRQYIMECPAIQVSDVWKRFDFLAW